MTLTLEQVRQTRFHLARRNGYEPVDVDNFVDKVEATLSQFAEENASLKRQLEAVGSSQPSSIFVPSEPGDSDRIRSDLKRREAELEAVRAELASKTQEATRNNEELGNVRNSLAAAQEALAKAKQESEALRNELASLRSNPATASAVGAAVPAGAIENIVVTSSQEASPAVTRLLQMATEQAERLVGESQAEAQRILSAARTEAENLIDSANRKAHEILTDARTRSDRVESEARVNAEKVTAEAQQRADSLNTEVAAKRSELFTQLETDRDTLRAKVDHLRTFETNYRNSLTNHLQNQLRAIGDAKLEPADVPELMNEPGVASATPRLDALLGDDHA